EKANYPILTNYFKSMDITLQNDGVIHGDLFCDNAKFTDNKLSGVYDFVEASEGDFIFELAVVSISWCFDGDMLNKEKVETLLTNYKLEISFEAFKEYIKYAILYYATQRYLLKRNYQALLEKLESL
ncbi:MAG: phosphotransferase, partial [Arcobacteraceae bacterium]